MPDVVIVEAKRTPMGSFLGSLSGVSATDLGANAIRATTSKIGTEQIDEVIMGCVLPAGLGQSPARQASLAADLSLSAGVTTINKVCGSGLKAVMLAHDVIQAGSAEIVVAGGMESMSNAPYLLGKARSGYRMGHGQLQDHMILDGLENAYDGKAMGCFAQSTADQNDIKREQMDNYAIRSLSRANQAIQAGDFEAEIQPVTVRTHKGDTVVSQDEGPSSARPEKIPHLKPAFAKDGTITAANSSSISDGAAALLVMSADKAALLNLQPLAKIRAHATHSIEPEHFTTAPIGAMQKVLNKAGWQKDDVDLWEINEAFAMVTMLATSALELDENKVNIRGGACALGHPIGASGARILVTLLHALQQKQLNKGIASLCIGGGEAVAMAVERV
jgi:acetyl-CoA C-acetyltransferase